MTAIFATSPRAVKKEFTRASTWRYKPPVTADDLDPDAEAAAMLAAMGE
jgi:hypothetical protein